jgi:cytochrome c oxidase subunit II
VAVGRVFGARVRAAPTSVRGRRGRDAATVRKRTVLVLGLAALALAAAACAPNATQSALEPKGPYAQKSYDLFVPVFWVAVGIFVIVEGALVLFAIRYRHRKNRTTIPAQVHGNTRLEIAWTILPTLILAGVAVPTIATIWDLAAKPTGNVLEVNVLGHQWWWEFDYPDQNIITANVLHIPTDRPVYVTLCAAGFGYGAGPPSEPGPPGPNACQGGKGQPPAAGIGASVIHSFWVPALAGTTDVVPGQTNYMTIQADEPGVYPGQCKEFCGYAHAEMKFTVVAQAPADFEQWVREQQAGAVAPPAGSEAAKGFEVFQADLPAGGHCTDCHAIDGLESAQGGPILANGAPNLTHFESRSCFAGCALANTDGNLRRWLEDPSAVKYGSFMPDYGLSREQIDKLIAFLNTLE